MQSAPEFTTGTDPESPISPVQRTRIILITGFLGAGKTSVLRHLLRSDMQSGEKKSWVIVNEFGKVSIDGPILKQYSPRITELNNGSIFCQCLAGTFVDSIASMLALGLSDLYIESTGLADPSNMQSILTSVKKKTLQPYVYAGVVCVVDAKYFRKLSQSNTMINRQILQSTLVILNKIDLINENEQAEARQTIRKLNPLAKILPSEHGQIAVDSIDFLRPSRLGRNLPSLNTPSNRSQTMVMQLTSPLQRNRLLAWLESLKGLVFRIKGFVSLEGEQGSWKVDLVGGEIRIESTDQKFDSFELVILPYLDLERIDSIRERTTETLNGSFHWLS